MKKAFAVLILALLSIGMVVSPAMVCARVNASMTEYSSLTMHTVSLTNETEITVNLTSQTYMLTVHVVDANTSGLISGGNVAALGLASRSGVTDGGTVVFAETQAGEYNITSSKTGYSSTSVSVGLTDDTEITIRLAPLTSEQILPSVPIWILAVLAVMPASAVVMAAGFVIILIAAADRIRRKRKKKYVLISKPTQNF
jgi:hypothetical protein